MENHSRAEHQYNFFIVKRKSEVEYENAQLFM